MRRRIVIGEDSENMAGSGPVEPYESEEWEYAPEEAEERPVGLVGTRGRALALGGSLVAVVLVLSAFVWLLSNRAGEQRTVSVATGASDVSSASAKSRSRPSAK